MRVLGALLLASAAMAAGAGDPTPAPDDSIQAAKKDFSAIKSSGVPNDSGSIVPNLEMKEIGPIPGGALQPTPVPTPLDGFPALDPAKKRTGTGNWLVDAMSNGDDDARPARAGDELPKGGADGTRSGDRSERRGDKDSQAPRDSGEKPGERPSEPKAYNPLDSFMAGWISARDRDLLLPQGRQEAAAGDAPKGRADSLPGLETGPSGGYIDSALPSPDVASWSDSKPAANPYLPVGDSPIAPPMKVFTAPEIPVFSPDGDPSLLRVGTAPGVDPPPIDATRSFIPDFAQPSEDDKYFRQMKRF
jgi:hypothetical protein